MGGGWIIADKFRNNMRYRYHLIIESSRYCSCLGDTKCDISNIVKNISIDIMLL